MSDDIFPSPTSPTSGSSSELAELRELCAELSWQTHTLRIALLVVATTVCAFFWLEGRRNSQALTLLRPQAAQVFEASKVQDPIANRFLGQLVEYGKAHPDFAPILKRYPIQGTPAPAATAPAIPASPSPKK
jgi:hypothetical protein